MTSIDNGIDIPASSRLSQVGDEILAEQARHALVDESLTARLKLNLLPDTGSYGPEAPRPAFSGSANADPTDYSRQIKIGPSLAADDNERFTDRIADKIYPGLGRIESQDPDLKWRLDYGDPSACRSKASVGMCFKLDFR